MTFSRTLTVNLYSLHPIVEDRSMTDFKVLVGALAASLLIATPRRASPCTTSSRKSSCRALLIGSSPSQGHTDLY